MVAGSLEVVCDLATVDSIAINNALVSSCGFPCTGGGACDTKACQVLLLPGADNLKHEVKNCNVHVR